MDKARAIWIYTNMCKIRAFEEKAYKLFEEKGTYQPCTIKITIHPVVHLEEMDKKQQKEVPQQVEDTIKSAL